jgi:hypothetical protein
VGGIGVPGQGLALFLALDLHADAAVADEVARLVEHGFSADEKLLL